VQDTILVSLLACAASVSQNWQEHI